MFQSIFKAAVFSGLIAAVAMFSSTANAQSGSRIFGGGSGSRSAPAQSFSAPAQSFSAPTQSFSAPTQSFSSGSGSRSLPTQSYAPTSTYQPAAPMPTTQAYSQPMAGSVVQAPMSSGCGCSGTTTSYAPAPVYSQPVYSQPVYSQPVYTPSNYNPGPIFRPFRSSGCGCR